MQRTAQKKEATPEPPSQTAATNALEQEETTNALEQEETTSCEDGSIYGSELVTSWRLLFLDLCLHALAMTVFLLACSVKVAPSEFYGSELVIPLAPPFPRPFPPLPP